MISFLLALLPLFQTPAPVPTPVTAKIYDFAPTIKGIILNSTPQIACYFWSQYPAPGQVEVACYEGTAIVHISVDTVNGKYDHLGSFTDPAVGTISWLYLVDTNGSMTIAYQITGAPSPLQGFPMVCCGPFETGVF